MSDRVQKWEPCPSCCVKVPLRDDGSFGRHYYVRDRVQYRCPQGELGRAPEPAGRRTTVVIDAVIPSEWTDADLRRKAGDILRAHLADTFVISLAVPAEDES